ncbi:centrosomal AT-AC splicing factor-like [Patiria miniata]|uniref:Coiled-coil domain-containing protein 84 n=1 Tax=Patiria miniata TaxID=46514 RepID=A0A914AQ93_PATMI|nr:centrosomal AT-AC splicing factor-like [Patiria miniata]
MAAPTKKQISSEFKQRFSYCELCRHSHDRGKKHAFSKRHREKVKAVLGKYGAKVKSARQDMRDPCILPGRYEADTKYWCYMCASEVHKHISDGEVTVRHAGFIEHLMSHEHAQKVDRFWRINRIETDLQPKFLISRDSQDKYKQAVEEALRIHEAKEERLMSQSAAKIRRVESNRSLLLQSSGSSTLVTKPSETFTASSQGVAPNRELAPWTTPTAPSGIGSAGSNVRDPLTHKAEDVPGCSHQSNGPSGEMHEQAVLHNSNQPDPASTGSNQFQLAVLNHSAAAAQQKPGVLSRVQTIGVISSGGLTAVHVKDRGIDGNIHTGALPPWLRDDDNEDTEEGYQKMGPSEVEFRKHTEQQRKSKLNPKRVGVNFDHTSPSNEEWLPSFGRVWNTGRRWQSRHQYRKEANQSKSFKRRRMPPNSTVSKPP